VTASKWLVVLALALAATAISVMGAGSRELPAMLLAVVIALVLPGYALSLAILPSIAKIERLLCSLGLSLAANVIGGLMLGLSPWGINRMTWAVWLGGVTLLSLIVAELRISGWQTPHVQQVSMPDWRSLARFGVALIVLGVAVFAAGRAATHGEPAFTELWSISQAIEAGPDMEVGIRSHEKMRTSYRLTVDSGSRRIAERTAIEVDPGEEWVTQVRLSDRPSQPVVVTLYRLDRPGEVYRTVRLSPAEFASAGGSQ
jgi:uncharacterized membrane protein